MTMNPIMLTVLQKNSADLEAIIGKIGIANLLSLMPHIMAIMATVEAQKAVGK